MTHARPQFSHERLRAHQQATGWVPAAPPTPSVQVRLSEHGDGWPEPIEVVIDDVSTDEGSARATFERLFPRLPPGAIYVVEVEAATRLVLALVLVRASSGGAVASVTSTAHWTAIERGPADLDPDAFRLDELYQDHFDLVAAVAP